LSDQNWFAGKTSSGGSNKLTQDISFTSKTETELESFNNIDYITLGYDILKGFPLTTYGIDPGFSRAPIFELTVTDRRTADGRFELPDGINVIKEESCNLYFSTTQVSSESDLKETLAIQASVEGEILGFSARASGEYNKMVSTNQKDDMSSFVSSAECQQYRAWLDLTAGPALHPTFVKDALQYLSDPANVKNYVKFLAKYGTHYVGEITMGGRISIIKSMKNSKLAQASHEDISVSVAASYSGIGSISGEFSYQNQKDAASNFEKNVAETKMCTIGSRPPADGDVGKWAESSFENPMPLVYQLKSITDIFTRINFAQNLFPDLNAVRLGLYRAQHDYCVSLIGSESACTQRPDSTDSVDYNPPLQRDVYPSAELCARFNPTGASECTPYDDISWVAPCPDGYKEVDLFCIAN
jgi:hypothetical protein